VRGRGLLLLTEAPGCPGAPFPCSPCGKGGRGEGLRPAGLGPEGHRGQIRGTGRPEVRRPSQTAPRLTGSAGRGRAWLPCLSALRMARKRVGALNTPTLPAVYVTVTAACLGDTPGLPGPRA